MWTGSTPRKLSKESIRSDVQGEGHCGPTVPCLLLKIRTSGLTQRTGLLSRECESLRVPAGPASRSSPCCISWLPMFLKLTNLDGREARGRRAQRVMGRVRWGGRRLCPSKPSATKQPAPLSSSPLQPLRVHPCGGGAGGTYLLQDHWMSQYADAQGQPGTCEKLRKLTSK